MFTWVTVQVAELQVSGQWETIYQRKHIKSNCRSKFYFNFFCLTNTYTQVHHNTYTELHFFESIMFRKQARVISSRKDWGKEENSGYQVTIIKYKNERLSCSGKKEPLKKRQMGNTTIHCWLNQHWQGRNPKESFFRSLGKNQTEPIRFFEQNVSYYSTERFSFPTSKSQWYIFKDTNLSLSLPLWATPRNSGTPVWSQ